MLLMGVVVAAGVGPSVCDGGGAGGGVDGCCCRWCV